MQLWRELIQIDKNFQTAVNLRLDRENMQKFTAYIPTASSTALLEQFFDNILRRKGNSASILIGPYGKGKSHLLLVLLALLEQEYPEVQDKVLEKIAAISPECVSYIRSIQKKGPFLTVLVSDNGNGMNASFLLALKEALGRKQLSRLMPNSYFEEALRCILRWKEDFPDTYRQLEHVLEKDKSMALPELTQRLESYEEDALELFRSVYPLLTAGTQFEPMINMEAAVLFQEINHKLVEEYGYQGIYVVFDEFSKYLEGHTQTGAGADMKVLQDLCELANAAQSDPFFITFVTHKSLREYNSRLSKEVQNQFRGIEGRLQEYLFVASVRNHFNLIGSVLQKTNYFEKAYLKLLKDEGISLLYRQTYEIPFFHAQFTWEEYQQIVCESSYPLTPFAAILLLNMSEKIAQNERTLFTYLTADEQGSIYRLVRDQKKKQETLLGADHIYDYFASTLKELTEDVGIHNEWLKAEYALHQTEDPIQRSILKAIATLRIAADQQETPVNKHNIWLALGDNQADIEAGIEELVSRNLLVWRSKLGCYAFKNNVGVNLEEELQTEMQRLSSKVDLVERLQEISELEYVLPKSYNQTFTITRYFQYVYMKPQVLYQIEDPSYLFEEQFSDGKIIALVREDAIDLEKVIEQSKSWMDSRIIFMVPHHVFQQEVQIKKYLAVQELLKNQEFIENNKVLEQELNLYAEDLLYEINAELEKMFLPQNQESTVIWNGQIQQFQSEKQFNAFLSEICGSYYNFSPKVNHELLNIQNVTGQYLKARNQIIEGILLGKTLEEYEKGTSPEAMVYRTALMRTGLRSKQYPLDPGTEHILEEIHQYITDSAKQKQCFATLYERLQGKEYGVRKGLMPLFIAIELMAVAGTPILYLQSREVTCTAAILNNINDRPEQYYLYLEQVEGGKEEYLSWLEDFLEIDKRGMRRQERFGNIAEAMQRRYRSLPQVVINWKEYEEAEWEEAGGIGTVEPSSIHAASEKIAGVLRKIDFNPRELLFEKIPSYFGQDQADLSCAQILGSIFQVWSGRLEWIQHRMVEECLKICACQEGETLSSHLRSWYRDKKIKSSQLILSNRASKLCECLNRMNSYHDEEVVADIAYAITGIHLEDWTLSTRDVFWQSFREALEEIEAGVQEQQEYATAKRIAFTDKEGNLVERYFQNEESGIGDFLKNAIKEALEEFGDSLEPSQKAAVLVETLEELLK